MTPLIMKNFKKGFTTKRNNRGLFSQLGIFALLAIFAFLAIGPLFGGQTLAQGVCAPITTVTEGNLYPGGTVSFGVFSGLGSVTVDHVNDGTGLQSLTVTGVPTNATVTMPSFGLGTFAPVVATFSCPSTNLATDFTLRAASMYHAINIRMRCGVAGCTRTQGYWKNHAENWIGQSLMLGTVTYTQSELLSIFDTPVRGNGLISLSHQLIAAKLNCPLGTIVPVGVANAMATADAMIAGKVVPAIGDGFLSTDSTSSLTAILDQFNNGNTPGGPPHCN